MQDKNEDGLIPGQPVDFATIQRIENSRKNKPEPEPAKRGRPAKQAEE